MGYVSYTVYICIYIVLWIQYILYTYGSFLSHGGTPKSAPYPFPVRHLEQCSKAEMSSRIVDGLGSLLGIAILPSRFPVDVDNIYI